MGGRVRVISRALRVLVRGFLLAMVLSGEVRRVEADGKVWSTGHARVDIPDQRALIHFTNGVERLVIDTAFVGPGTNFAWVIPLPAAPTIEPVSSGVFTTLPVIFQPRVVLRVEAYWGWVMVMGGMVTLVVLVARVRWQPLRMLLMVWVGFGLLVVFMMPAARSKAGVAASAAMAGVQVLERQRVGRFETTTLRAEHPAGLAHWLATHGFPVASNALPVVADYIEEGWVFVATRLARTADTSEPSHPHPLSFTFPTRRAVYPMRLTGVDNGRCVVDLYVFGPERAEVAGFRVTRCDRPTYGESLRWPAWQAGKVRIRQRELLGWVKGAPVATKLTGTFLPGEMTRDGVVRWVPYRSEGATVYALGAALTLAGNVATFCLLLGVPGLWWASRRWLARPLAADGVFKLAVGAVCVGALTFLFTPRVAGGDLRIQKRLAMVEGKHLTLCLALALEDEGLRDPAPEQLSRMVRELGPYYWAGPSGGRAIPNVFTGGRVDLEESPGNLWVRGSTNGLELIWHDLDGAPGWTNRVFEAGGR